MSTRDTNVVVFFAIVTKGTSEAGGKTTWHRAVVTNSPLLYIRILSSKINLSVCTDDLLSLDKSNNESI